MKYCIYKLCDNDNLLYVGKTNDFYKRLYHHRLSKIWAKEITYIEFAECNNRIDMDIYEKYYINKLIPKYNEASVYNEIPTFKIEELNFKRYKLEDFIEKNKDRNSELQMIYRNHSKVNEIINGKIVSKNVNCENEGGVLKEVLTFEEATKQWNLSINSIGKLIRTNKLIKNEDYRLIKSTGLITRKAMEKFYGKLN